MWVVASSISDGTAYSNYTAQTGYTMSEYTSYGTVNNQYTYINDKYLTYLSENGLTDYYDTTEDILNENIDWLVSIYVKSADANTATIEERKTVGNYTYRIATFKEGGSQRSILCAVRTVDSRTIECLFMDVEGDAGNLSQFLEFLKS
jgi:hypothetical protein